MAVILDPRYKFGFVEYILQREYGDVDGKRLASDLKVAINELFECYKSIHQTQSSGSDTSNDSSSQGQTSQKIHLHTLYTDADDWIKKRRGGGVLAKNEIDVYLKEDPLDVEQDDFDILKWWKMNQLRFPVLSLIVRDIFSMPISTVASESAFSMGSRVLDSFRSSLAPKVVEALLCAQDWLRGSNAPKSIEEDLESILMDDEVIANIEASLAKETPTNEVAL